MHELLRKNTSAPEIQRSRRESSILSWLSQSALRSAVRAICRSQFYAYNPDWNTPLSNEGPNVCCLPGRLAYDDDYRPNYSRTRGGYGGGRFDYRAPSRRLDRADRFDRGRPLDRSYDRVYGRDGYDRLDR